MMALLSVAPPLSPRLTNARQTFSRAERTGEAARNGSTLERVLTTTNLPESLRAAAFEAAASFRPWGRPARSASESSIQVLSSASRFWLNLV